jgi:hypothetical protein
MVHDLRSTAFGVCDKKDGKRCAQKSSPPSSPPSEQALIAMQCTAGRPIVSQDGAPGVAVGGSYELKC